MHVGDSGVVLNSDTELMVDGALHVGYAHVLELRKLNGRRRVPRLSVRAKDASRCSAVILPLVKRGGRWVPDRIVAPPVLVPLLSLPGDVWSRRRAAAIVQAASRSRRRLKLQVGRSCARHS